MLSLKPDRTAPRRIRCVSNPAVAVFMVLALLYLLHLNDFTNRRFYITSIAGIQPNHEVVVRKQFDWEDIAPSTKLEFHPCFTGGYECARLEVPLDWTNTSEFGKNRYAAIAITRLPAKVSVTDSQYGGAVLINPGGPSGSGVSLVTRQGKDIQTVVDTGAFPTSCSEHTGLHFDIIGFDPRGVNNTTPSANCFPDDGARQFWSIQSHAHGMLSNNHTFPFVYGRTQALAGSCSGILGHEEQEEVGRYMSTPSVVEDMVAIIEALGEWRESKAKTDSIFGKAEMTPGTVCRTKWHRGEEKLLFWGFSYGTLLGATFASMHPDRIGRMVLDGVVDAVDYYAGTWLSNLYDTDAIIESFFKQCYAAGPDQCAIFSPHGASGSRNIFDSVMTGLYLQPLPVPAVGKYGPDLITWSDAIRYATIDALYKPQQSFVRLARVIHDLAQGNGTEVAMMKQDGLTSFCRSPLCEQNPYSKACHNGQTSSGDGLSAAILCTDGSPSLRNWTAQDHYDKWKYLEHQCGLFAPYWAEITMYCSAWNLRPVWNFTYPQISSNETANPILFVSNTRDPVTPIRNAIIMRTKFNGSGLLVQDADGHCSISAPGTCAAGKIRAYFQKGELPKEGLLCSPNRTPFEAEAVFLGDEENELDLFNAVERLGGIPRLGGEGVLHV